MQAIVLGLDRCLGLVARLAGWLALPVVLALFLQWPLRDWAQCCSREVNDLAQWLFAIYVAVAVLAATRANTHLRVDMLARNHTPRVKAAMTRAGAGLILLPFALVVISASWPGAATSFSVFERFPDTLNPGYFIIKLSAPLMGLLLALQALVELTAPDRERPSRAEP